MVPGKKRLQKTWDEVNMYFRIIHPFGIKPTLLAQAPGSRGPFHGPISKITHRKGHYKARSKLKLPEIHGVNFILYGFTSTDINGDGKNEAVVLDENYHLRVYSASGRTLVKSDEYYGADPRVMDLGVIEDAGEVVQEGDPVSFRGRLQFVLQNKKRYLLLPKNSSSGGSLTPGLMLDTHGSVSFLSLDKEGFQKAFEIKRQKGYLAAYSTLKAQKNTPKSLHMATVEMGGDRGGKTTSMIYTYFWRK